MQKIYDDDRQRTHTHIVFVSYTIVQKVLFFVEWMNKKIDTRSVWFGHAARFDGSSFQITLVWSMLNRYHIGFAAHFFFIWTLSGAVGGCRCRFSMIVKCYSNHDSCYSVRGFTKLISRQQIVWLTLLFPPLHIYNLSIVCLCWKH